MTLLIKNMNISHAKTQRRKESRLKRLTFPILSSNMAIATQAISNAFLINPITNSQ